METELPDDIEETPDGTPDDDEADTPEPENDVVEDAPVDGAEGDGAAPVQPE